MNKRIIRLTESDLHRIVRESVNRILTETHTRKLYHFVTPKQLQYIFRYGFNLNNREANYSISPQLPNFLSFTRNRNAVQGFPFMNTDYYGGGGTTHYEASDSGLLIRLEIDGETLNRYGKVKPFDYLYHINKEEQEDYLDPVLSSKEDVVKTAIEYPNLDSPIDKNRTTIGQEIYNQPFSQAEERLFSKLKKIPKEDALKLITRIDVYVNTYTREEAIEFYKFSNWLYNRNYQLIKDLGIKVMFYDNIDDFNLQTDKTMKKWKWDYYATCYRERNRWY